MGICFSEKKWNYPVFLCINKLYKVAILQGIELTSSIKGYTVREKDHYFRIYPEILKKYCLLFEEKNGYWMGPRRGGTGSN